MTNVIDSTETMDMMDMDITETPERRDRTDRLVSVKQAASRLSCSEGAIRKWMTQGKIQRVKVGRLTRIRTQDLDACIRLGLQPQE